MEFPIRLWMGIVVGWRNRMLVIEDDGYIIKRVKKKNIFSKFNSIKFSLNNANIIDVPPKKHKNITEEDLEIVIETLEYKNNIKAVSRQDKVAIMNKLNDVIKDITEKNAFSSEYQKYQNEILKQSQTKFPFDYVTIRLTHFQNLFLEMNKKLDTLKTLIHEKNIKNKQEDFLTVHSNLVIIKEEMKKQFDDLIEKVYNYHEEMEGNTHPVNQINSISSGNLINEAIQENPTDIDSISVSSDDETGKNEMRFSFDPKDFVSPLYNYPARTSLSKEIKCGSNMIKEFIKAMSGRKSSLPIYFNEPISMLQKQCERFYFIDQLTKAANETKRENQLLHISAFIIGEIFLNIGRFLKPFNPILGETYEFFDNSKHFRYFSEQVSHNPPISAYIGETDQFVMFGDTRATTSFKLLKGCLEVEFGNKTHLLLKTTNDYYTFNKPSVLMKGFIRQPIYSDYIGEIVIQNSMCSACKCVLTFYEGNNKKPLGSFDGKIFDNDGTLVYILGGNWKSEIYATDAEGNNKIELLKLDPKEEYVNNTAEKYVIPSYTSNLNSISDELEKVLPKCDSRLRPDLREYEGGSTEVAQDLKNKIEMKQSLRHQKFEEDKIKYNPHYFVNEQNEKSKDNVYTFNGKYWNDRKTGKVKELKDSDIFEVSNISLTDKKA